MPDGFVATPCRATRAVLHADSVSSSQSADLTVSRSSVGPSSEGRLVARRTVADAVDNDRPRLFVAEEVFETQADDSAETRLAALEQLADDDTRLTAPRELVGEDLVMYATDDALMKATT